MNLTNSSSKTLRGRDLKDILQAAREAAALMGPSDPIKPLPLEMLEAPFESAGDDLCEDAQLPQVEGYEVCEEIDSGGQATVFKAIQKSTGQTVAIKVLPGGRLVGARRKERFDREAHVLASLTHPNIVKIIDRGMATDGSLYLVMHYVDGLPLDHYAQKHDNGGIERLVRLFVKICRAVDDAHRNGVIHRDLKPGNILVDLRGEPHVLDFGLARVLDEGHGSSFVTATVQVLGSLAWASPEQASGRSSVLDARSDVYSLGVMLYQALTGQFPYSADVPIPDLVTNIVSVVPKPPSRQMNEPPPTAAMLDAIVRKALAKAPASRYPSAGELADDLEKYLADQGGTSRRIAVPRPRKRAGVALVGAVAAVLVGVGGWRSWHKARGSDSFAHRSSSTPSLGAQSGGTPPDTHQFKAQQKLQDEGAGRSSFINSVGMRMVLIPAGTFMMGSPEGELGRRDMGIETQHEVTISHPFYMGAMLVTRDQYKQLMKIQGEDTPVPGNTPVNYVSWFDATRYCELLSEREHRHYHLPTEAQWEYACRAGTTGMFGGTGRIDDMGWFGKDWPTPPVGGQKQPNAWGIYDMHGNLKQWCLDYQRDYPLAPEVDPVWNGGKLKLFAMLRGGDYHLDLAECRSAARAWTEPKDRNRWIGFRVAMDMTKRFSAAD